MGLYLASDTATGLLRESTMSDGPGLKGNIEASAKVLHSLFTGLDRAILVHAARVRSSTFRDNAEGVYADQLIFTNNRLTGNGPVANGQDAVVSGYEVAAAGNVLRDNRGHGISTQRGTLLGNDIRGQAKDGIHVVRPAGEPDLVVRRNQVIGNGGWGIDAPRGVITAAGGNVARDNAVGQCRGVTCSAE